MSQLDLANHFANWKKEQMINKACEWLQDNVELYVDYDGELDYGLLDDFKKAMEG